MFSISLIRYLLLTVLVCVATFPLSPARAQTVVQSQVAGAVPVELFKFSTPAGAPAANRMVIANLIVNDAASELVFQLAPVVLNPNYDPENFATAGTFSGNQSLQNNVTTDTVFEVRARDLTPTLTGSAVPQAGFRLIKLRVKLNSSYNYPALEWSVRAQPLAAGAITYLGFRTEGDGADATTVEDTLTAQVTRPRLIAPQADLTNFATFINFPAVKTLDFGEVHINLADAYRPDQIYEFTNVGTGPLEIDGVSPTTWSGTNAFKFLTGFFSTSERGQADGNLYPPDRLPTDSAWVGAGAEGDRSDHDC